MSSASKLKTGLSDQRMPNKQNITEPNGREKERTKCTHYFWQIFPPNRNYVEKIHVDRVLSDLSLEASDHGILGVLWTKISSLSDKSDLIVAWRINCLNIVHVKINYLYDDLQEATHGKIFEQVFERIIISGVRHKISVDGKAIIQYLCCCCYNAR